MCSHSGTVQKTFIFPSGKTCSGLQKKHTARKPYYWKAKIESRIRGGKTIKELLLWIIEAITETIIILVTPFHRRFHVVFPMSAIFTMFPWRRRVSLGNLTRFFVFSPTRILFYLSSSSSNILECSHKRYTVSTFLHRLFSPSSASPLCRHLHISFYCTTYGWWKVLW